MGASVQLSLWKGLRPLSSVLQVLVVGRYHVPHATAKADLRSKSSCTCVRKRNGKVLGFRVLVATSSIPTKPSSSAPSIQKRHQY
mmetsp:Transcript_38477/g.77589  ORF Transcript_38477/g.77589 Transcript_38477/m.77589 type:complete len:85 (+) Transcript_38477:666-920(+)